MREQVVRDEVVEVDGAERRGQLGVPSESHPDFHPHPVQGWSPDFVPKLVEDARPLVDEFMPVPGAEALQLARELAQREGIFAGISAGATLAGALRIASRERAGTRILCMLPDTGERYLSTPLFEDVAVNMTEEELAISHSTPSSRFDKAPDVPPVRSGQVLPTPEARALVEQAITSPEQPVVMFALEWCEYCWAVRRLFARCNISYRSIDIDAASYKPDHAGDKIRAALSERTGIPTIPQVFVGGTLIGGATDTFAAFEHGKLQKLLERSQVAFEDKREELHLLMPQWALRT
jgi:cysteine synthase A